MKLLVIRFSALGDVAMTVPVIYSLALQYPDLSITVLSKSFVAPLFAQMPTNVTFYGVNLNDFHGIRGLFRLYKLLKKENYDFVADIHDVIRTKVLRFFFRMTGIRVAHIDKGRGEKRALCRSKNKQLVQLKTSFERYAEVFKLLGFPITLNFKSIFGVGKGNSSLFNVIATPVIGQHWIGIAPFAAHQGKMLPITTVNEVISILCSDQHNHLFLFGGGDEEKHHLQKMAEGKPQVTVVAGRLTMAGELALMSHLNVMVSMDSANMHLASLTGIPVVSVWGATHPYAGFMGWAQQHDHAVQATLSCRPCSVFGNKPCFRGDYACLYLLTAQEIINKVTSLLPHES